MKKKLISIVMGILMSNSVIGAEYLKDFEGKIGKVEFSLRKFEKATVLITKNEKKYVGFIDEENDGIVDVFMSYVGETNPKASDMKSYRLDNVNRKFAQRVQADYENFLNIIKNHDKKPN